MMNHRKTVRKVKQKAGVLVVGAMLFGFPWGGCQIDQITTTTTLDGREVMISLIRGAVLSPIDAWITQGVNDLFDELVDDDE